MCLTCSFGAQIPQLRQRALEVLAAAVGGDTVVAEYLLLQLVSRCFLGTSLYFKLFSFDGANETFPGTSLYFILVLRQKTGK